MLGHEAGKHYHKHEEYGKRKGCAKLQRVPVLHLEMAMGLPVVPGIDQCHCKARKTQQPKRHKQCPCSLQVEESRHHYEAEIHHGSGCYDGSSNHRRASHLLCLLGEHHCNGSA